MALTNKQRLFVDEYFRCNFNASEAARRAGYSEKTARSIGHENLTKPEIDAEIKRRVAEQTMGPDEVLIRLGEQARAEYSQYITAEGAVDLTSLIADGKAHLIKGIKETAHGRTIEFYDGQAALVQIGKHHQLFATKVEHTGSLDLNVVKGYMEVTPDDWDKD